jgi:NAD(P)-dependent dehydrogenase (short-subunit alcohol dehydrogenase family)
VNLNGKNIMITGAGRGIGQAIAKTCAADGAVVILLARTENELYETVEEITGAGGRAYMHVCDISHPQSVEKAFAFARQQCGSIHVLVNNAGVQSPIGEFKDTDVAEWKKNVEINLFGMIHCTKTVLPDMLRAKKGKIITIAGGGATSPRPNFSAYAVAKTAIVRFTETLALELKEFNIDVNGVSPGAINTRMLKEVIEAGELSGQELSEAKKRMAGGGDDPQAAAELIAFLASEASNGITGKLISARWDPWKEADFQYKLKTDSNIAVLRRIDEINYQKKTRTDVGNGN